MKNTKSKSKNRIKTLLYILTLRLETDTWEEAILNKRFEIGRKIYNVVLGLALKKYNGLIERKKYSIICHISRNEINN